MASAIKSISAGCNSFFSVLSSFINSSSMCSRPAVSTRTTSLAESFASLIAPRTISSSFSVKFTNISAVSQPDPPLYRNFSGPASAPHSFSRFWSAERSLRTLRYRDAHKCSGIAEIFICCGKRHAESLCNREIGRVIIREATDLCKGRQLQNFGGRLLRALDWKGLQPHKEPVNLIQRDTLAAIGH